MHLSLSSALHPAFPSDCVLHWEASSVSPPCCVRIVSLWCVDLQLWCNLSHKWICTSWVTPTQSPTIQDVQLCPALPTCSDPILPLNPTPTNCKPPHPHPSLVCTTSSYLLAFSLNPFFFTLHYSILFDPLPLKPSYTLTVPAVTL